MGQSLIKKICFPKVCGFCRRVLLEEKDLIAKHFSEHYGICRKCLSEVSFRDSSEQVLPCLSSDHDDEESMIKAIVPLNYQGKVISALRALKFSEAIFHAPFFAFFILKALDMQNVDFDVVIPVPLSRERLKARKYNQAELIARSIAQKRGLICTEMMLYRLKNTLQQSSLGETMMRAQNVSGAFAVPETTCVEGLRILLVDDVMTTGNTLYEAASTLYLAGAQTVWVTAVASGRFY